MSDERTYGREPITIVELTQPRCALRFGVAPCTAIGPKCYNTNWTCGDRANYDGSGVIRWRFIKPEAGLLPLYEQDGDNDISTNPIPILASVSSTSTRINVAARREGESPLGKTGSVKLTFTDEPWLDSVGDFYLADRSGVSDASFWAKWQARNEFWPNVELTVYEGYRGQALGDMQSRVYVLDGVSGPSNGVWTVTGVDPIQLAGRKRALFPRPSNITLAQAVTAGSTANINVTCAVAELSADYGNTGSARYLRVGSEIIAYTGWTGTAPNLTLTGVSRGNLGTATDDHDSGDSAQRVGRYNDILPWVAMYDLFTVHTTIDAGYIDYAAWVSEGTQYRPTTILSGTVAEPTPVEDLLGELCRDSVMSLWWDERLKTIPLLASRPPNAAPYPLTERDNIISAQVQRRQQERLTRVSVLWGEVDPTARREYANFTNQSIRINGDFETVDLTGGEIRELVIFSRWIRTGAVATSLGASILQRFTRVPVYAQVELDAKDRANVRAGSVVDLSLRDVIDAFGDPVQQRMQVIAYSEPRAGDTVSVELEAFLFVGRFAFWMADGTPNYLSASEQQTERGFFWANDLGEMSNGDEGYKWQ